MNYPIGAADPQREKTTSTVCILLNPGSGKRRGQHAETEIRAVCADLPLEVTVRQLQKKRPIGEQARTAMAEGFDIIVAAGGDGTICGVAAALAGSNQVMGVLPLGTFNYFARSLEIPETIEGALAVLAERNTRNLTVGRVNGRVFLNNASLGAYPAILKTREQIYARWGRSRLAAYWSVLVALLKRNHCMNLRVTVDGQERSMRSPLVFLMLNEFQLKQLGLDGADIINSGKFAIFIAPDEGRWGMIRQAIGLARGTLVRARDFELLAGDDVTIATGRSRSRIARDGEREVLSGPFHFQVLREALTVVVPASTRAKAW